MHFIYFSEFDRFILVWRARFIYSRVAMRSPLPFPCVPDRPYKILLAQVGTLSFSHPLFGVSVLFIYLFSHPSLGLSVFSFFLLPALKVINEPQEPCVRRQGAKIARAGTCSFLPISQ